MDDPLKKSRRLSSGCLEELKTKSKECQELLLPFQWVLEDSFLLHFVRGCKYDPDKAFNVLKNYFSLRVKLSPLFIKMIPSRLQEVCKILNHRGPQGQFIVIMRACWWDLSSLSTDDLILAGMANYEVMWNDKATEINGIIGIWDCSGFNYSHFKELTPRQVNKIINVSYRTFPLRICSIHALNVPIYFRLAYNVAKPLLPTKLRSRVFIHGSDLTNFYKHIPQDKLPLEIGGELDDEKAYQADIYPSIIQKENYYLKFSATLKSIQYEYNTS